MSMSYCKVKSTRTRGMKASVFNPQRILINLHYNISRRPRKLYPTGSVSNRSKARKGKTTRGMKASVINPKRILMNLHYSNSRHLRKLYPKESVSTRSKARKGKRTRKTEPWKRESKGRLWKFTWLMQKRTKSLKLKSFLDIPKFWKKRLSCVSGVYGIKLRKPGDSIALVWSQ